MSFTTSSTFVTYFNHAIFFTEDFGTLRIYGCFGAVASGVVVGLWRYCENPSITLRGSLSNFMSVLLTYIVRSSLNILALSCIRLKSGLEDRWDFEQAAT